jgi:hypothetical protein
MAAGMNPGVTRCHGCKHWHKIKNRIKMMTTVLAKITGATPVETFQGRDGQTITKCTIVVKTIESYPQTLALNVFGELTPFAQQTGRIVEISVGMQSREYESRWYSELKAVSIRYALLPADALPTAAAGNAVAGAPADRTADNAPIF